MTDRVIAAANPRAAQRVNGHPKLDRLDLRILCQLQKNGRIANIDLAEAVGLSPSPCLVRLKRLERAGYVAGYGARIRLDKLGETLVVFTEVTLTDHRREDFVRFESSVRPIDEIVECHLVSGGYDYLLKFITCGIDHYQEIIEGLLRHNIGIEKILQLHRHQVAVHQEPLPDRTADHCGELNACRDEAEAARTAQRFVLPCCIETKGSGSINADKGYAASPSAMTMPFEAEPISGRVRR